jgi:RNA polymerase sigma-70 factor (ECF subfamily)
VTCPNDDGRLAGRAARGDRVAFAQLVRRYGPALTQFARLSGTPETDVDDIVQDAFIAAWRRLDNYDEARPFRAWLFRIAINKIHDLRRGRRVRRFLFAAEQIETSEASMLADPAPGPEREALARRRLEDIKRMMGGLDPELRDAIILTAILGLSQGEAAETLGISLKSIEGRVARARRQLALMLEG